MKRRKDARKALFHIFYLTCLAYQSKASSSSNEIGTNSTVASSNSMVASSNSTVDSSNSMVASSNSTVSISNSTVDGLNSTVMSPSFLLTNSARMTSNYSKNISSPDTLLATFNTMISMTSSFTTPYLTTNKSMSMNVDSSVIVRSANISQKFFSTDHQQVSIEKLTISTLSNHPSSSTLNQQTVFKSSFMTTIENHTPSVMLSMKMTLTSILPSPSPSLEGSTASSVMPTHPDVIVSKNNINGLRLNTLAQISTSNIAISKGSSDGSCGNIEINVKGSWVFLGVVSTTTAKVIASTDMIRFNPAGGCHGAISFNYSLTTSDSASIDVRGLSTHMIILVVHPTTPTVRYNKNETEFSLTAAEDNDCVPVFKLSNYIEILPVTGKSNIHAEMTGFIPSAIMNAYLSDLTRYAAEWQSMFYIKEAISANGEWYYLSTNQTFPFKSRKYDYFGTDVEYCFKPSADWHGTTTFIFQGALKSSATNSYEKSSTDIVINLNITAVNDRPKLNGPYYIALPYLAFNKTNIDTSGILVSAIANKKITFVGQATIAEDPDGSVPGFAIVNVQGNAYGRWVYQCSGSKSWITINITNLSPLNSSSLVTILLRLEDRFRFEMNDDLFWGKSNGIQEYNEPQVMFLAWDQSDGHACGKYTYTSPDVEPEALSEFNNAHELQQYRLGCANAPWTPDAVLDECGVCGGDNSSCLGCDGVLNSGAQLDSCMNCTGGTTGVVVDYLKDCFQQCGRYYVDSCGLCTLKGLTTATDCNNDCGGNAFINNCGACVGGKTGKAETHWQDACSVCNGTNATCTDCSGIINGDKRVDLCNKCLSPVDPNFDSSCVSLGNFRPKLAYTTGGTKIELAAAGLNRYESVSCSFKGSSVVLATFSIFKTENSRKTKIEITTPPISAGSYKISCQLGSDPNYESASSILFIDESTMTVTSVSPTMSPLNTPVSIVFTGSGFINTTELVCLYGEERQQLQATFISATSISCDVPSQSKSRSNDIVLSFVDLEREKHTSLKGQHNITVKVPNVISAMFNDDAAFVELTFNDSVSFATLPGRCQDVFPSDYTKFGTMAVCKFTSDRIMKIIMLGGPTLSSENLNIDLTKVQAKGAEITLYPHATQTIAVSLPSNTITPLVKVRGPKRLGQCDEFDLQAAILGGSGGRTLTYSWSVKWADANSGSPNGAQTADIGALNSMLAGLSSDTYRVQLAAENGSGNLIGSVLTYMVNATNFLGASGLGETNVQKENKALPRLSMSETKIEQKAAEDLIVEATATISGCIDRNTFAAKLIYQWSILPGVGINLPITSLRQLKIPAGQLKVGKTYSLICKVSMAQNTELSVSGQTTLTTLSSPLIATIKSVQTVGADGTLELNGAESNDPDQSEGSPTYDWSVTNPDDSPVVMNGQVVTLPKTSRIEVDVRKTLLAGKTYKVTLKYRVGIREAFAIKMVTVVKGDPPTILISPVGVKQNPSQKVTLETTLKTTSTCYYEWESVGVADDRYATIELSEKKLYTKKSGNFIGNMTSALVIKPNVLSGGTIYRFQLKATNAGNEAETFIDIQTNGVPTPGVVTITPVTGISLNTTFTIEITEGCIDPDGETVKYRFGYRKSDGSETQVFAKQTDIQMKTTLPAGTLIIFAQCIDTQGSYSENIATQVVNVTIADVSAAAFSSFQSKMNDLADQGDLDRLAGTAITIMNAAGDGETSDALKSFQSETTELIARNLVNIQSKSQRENFIKCLSKTTSGGKNFMDKAKRQEILEAFRLINGGDGTARRRRALSGTTVEEKSVEEVQNILQTYVNLIDQSQYDPVTMSSKSELLNEMDKFAQSMCVNLAPGETARIAQSDFVTIQSINLQFANVDTTYLALGCSNCTSMPEPEYVLLGTTLKSSYQSWNCDPNSVCTGACVTTFQMPYDFLSSSFNESIMSGVTKINLFNPKTHDELVLNDLNDGMLFRLRTKKQTNNTYECRRWDITNSVWTTDHITTLSGKSMSINNVSYVQCSSKKFGYVVLFEGPPMNESNSSVLPSMTTSISPASSTFVTSTSIITTTVAPENFVRDCKLIFTGNCTQAFNSSTKANVENDLKKQIASQAKLNETFMRNFTIRCGSIVAEWQQSADYHVTAEAATALLAATFASSVTLIINGQNVSSSSFTAVTITPSYYTTLPPAVVTNNGLSRGEIAGIVIGVIVFVVIMIALVYFLMCRKKTRKNPTVEPNGNDVELIGKRNEGYNKAF